MAEDENGIGVPSKKEGAKKQIPLRLSAQLYGALAAWAEDEFRSVNGQIEYLLTECVRKRHKGNSDCR
ncbi:MAG: PTS ascorbate transporter subunit IIC [Oscillospiraceae bacterium]